MGVHGLDGLRVVDASVMPYVTNGNIYAPVMMTAEKAPTSSSATPRWLPSRSSSTGTARRRGRGPGPPEFHPHQQTEKTVTHLFIDGQWVSPRVPASAEVINRSWALSNSEHCPAGGPERSWVTWSGGVPRKAVTVFRHGRGRRWAWRDPPSLLTRPARGRSGGSSHGPILWPGSCHTCASSRPRTFCVLLKDTLENAMAYEKSLSTEQFPTLRPERPGHGKRGRPGRVPGDQAHLAQHPPGPGRMVQTLIKTKEPYVRFRGHAARGGHGRAPH